MYFATSSDPCSILFCQQNNLFSMFSAFISQPHWWLFIQMEWLLCCLHSVWIRERWIGIICQFVCCVWHNWRQLYSGNATVQKKEKEAKVWKQPSHCKCHLYVHTLVYGNAASMPEALTGRMMTKIRSESKSHYTSLWVLLSPPTDNCTGLQHYARDSLVPFLYGAARFDLQTHWCEHSRRFMMSFCVTRAGRSWDCEIVMGREKGTELVLISREEWRREE